MTVTHYPQTYENAKGSAPPAYLEFDRLLLAGAWPSDLPSDLPLLPPPSELQSNGCHGNGDDVYAAVGSDIADRIVAGAAFSPGALPAWPSPADPLGGRHCIGVYEPPSVSDDLRAAALHPSGGSDTVPHLS